MNPMQEAIVNALRSGQNQQFSGLFSEGVQPQGGSTAGGTIPMRRAGATWMGQPQAQTQQGTPSMRNFLMSHKDTNPGARFMGMLSDDISNFKQWA